MRNFELCARQHISSVSKLDYLQLPVCNMRTEKKKAVQKECGIKFCTDGGLADNKIAAVFLRVP